jgi:tetratricopeptide (TPR) repeat protein
MEVMEEAEGILFRWSLISLKDGQYLLHTLIREFFAEKLRTELKGEAAELQRGMAEAMVTEAKTVDYPITRVDLARVQWAIPHWQVVIEGLTGFLSDDKVDWSFVALGRVAEGQNRWQEAEHWWQASLEMSEKRFGVKHFKTANALNNLAELYRMLGRYEDALPLHARALTIYEQELGISHPLTTTSVNNLVLSGLSKPKIQSANSLPLNVH